MATSRESDIDHVPAINPDHASEAHTETPPFPVTEPQQHWSPDLDRDTIREPKRVGGVLHVWDFCPYLFGGRIIAGSPVVKAPDDQGHEGMSSARSGG